MSVPPIQAPADPAQRRLQLHYAVTRACDEAAGVDGAIDAVMACIGERFGWPAGVLWRYDRHSKQLKLWRAWSSDAAQRERLERRLARAAFGPSDGLPGQTFFLGEPAFSPTRSASASGLDLEAAASARLAGALCVPFRSPRAILGCAEFFAETDAPPAAPVVDAVEDVIIRLAAYCELHAAADELEALVRAFPDLYFCADANGVILDFHASAATGLHHLASQCVGKRVQEFVTPDVAPRIEAAMRAAQESGDLATVTYSLPLPTSARAFELRVVPMRGDQFLCVVRDVTEPPRVEPRLAPVRASAAPLFEALDALLASALTDAQRAAVIAAQSTARALL